MEPLLSIIEFLKQTDQLTVASTLLSAFEKYSQTLEQKDVLGKLYNDIKNYKKSIQLTEEALALSSTPQQLYSCRANLAKLYNHTNNPNKALMYINANLKINPNDYEAIMEKIFSLYLNADFKSSKQLTLQLLTDQNTPKNIKDRCTFNYGSYLLDEDKFQEGLKGFIETGHGDIQIWKNIDFPGTKWEGDITPGKNIVIVAEGGIGDEIINIRFMYHIKKLGMNPIFVTNRVELVKLFNRNGFNCVPDIRSVPEDSEFCLAMYLPILLNLQPNDLWYGTYLTPDPNYIEKWKKYFIDNNLTKPKVAIRYGGNPYYEQDLHRSIPLNELDKAINFQRNDIQFISIQRENNEELVNYPNIHHVHTETIEDLLAVLSLMKTTITSCTSIAHITAAAGYDVHVCPPIATYYVWLGTNPSWYGENCHIHRQKKWKNYDHLKNITI
jgi:tetratricopeptide (TPR) repeat protein